MVNRQSRKLSPLASAVRIAPLTAALAGGGVASAATIPVTDSGGFATGDSCTIVDAVNSINNGATQAACKVTGTDPFGSNDTVDLTGFADPTTITFQNVASSSALSLFQKATIRGSLDNNGQPLVTLAIAANAGPARLISTTRSLVVDSLALTGGSVPGAAGGAILTGNAVSALTLTHALVTGNSARTGGGVAAYNTTVNVSDSIVSGNYAALFGGGISCRTCSPVIVDSTVSGNYVGSGFGGGIYSHFNVVVTGSIVSGNYASGGGGIAGLGFVSIAYTTVDDNHGGGGVTAPTVNVNHSTISGNTARYSGGGVSATSATITSSTISGNTAHGFGGGVYATDAASFTATTISNNRIAGFAGANGAGVFIGNAIAFMSGTLVFGNAGGSDIDGAAFFNGSNNLVGTSGPSIILPGDTLNCDPHLAPLADNGGFTATQALPFGSCAIDAGPAPGTSPYDQRGVGFARTVGAASDIGAFEAQIVDEIFKDGFEFDTP